MKVKFAHDPLDKSIFLAGPTPRYDTLIPSWRPLALHILKEMQFNGTVFVPEASDWTSFTDYDGQIRWEWEGINQATVVAFWVPRDLEDMPAFTTNVEYGMTLSSTKAVLGYPQHAPKMGYLQKLAERYHIPVRHDLTELLATCVLKTQRPFDSYTL